MAALLPLLGAWALLAAPSVIDTRRLSPRWSLRLQAGSLVAGFLILQSSLILLAAPTVLRAIGLAGFANICDRLLVNVGIYAPRYVGWPAFLALAAGWFSQARGWILHVVETRKIHKACTPSTSWSYQGVPVALVAAPFVSAFGLGGRKRRIVVSSGLIAAFDPAELDVVLGHEAAHIHGRHPALLGVIRAVELGTPMFRPVRRSASWVRLAVERVADEVAAGGDETRRRVAVGALLKATGVDTGVVTALSPAETLARRIHALQRPDPVVARMWTPVAAMVLMMPLVISVAGLANWVIHANVALALSGWCPA